MTGGMARRWEVCAWACAQAWRGDGEILASAMGTMPTAAARLARATFGPDLVVSDGGARFVEGTWPVDEPAPGATEGWAPFRSIFDFAASGRRHAMMGASQLDETGQSNISCIGDYRMPTRQLLGVRGVPTNSVNHPVSYWIPRHSPKVFVPRVDVVSGVGHGSDLEGTPALRFASVRLVVTNLAVLDFAEGATTLRVRSVHPWSSLDEVRAQTGFELHAEDSVPVTEAPDDAALHALREQIDPRSTLAREVPDE